MDPQMLALLNTGANFFGKALSAPPSSATSSNYLDASGFTVNFGSGSASSSGSTGKDQGQWQLMLMALAGLVFYVWNA